MYVVFKKYFNRLFVALQQYLPKAADWRINEAILFYFISRFGIGHI